jgi:hypothetical protein
MKKTKIKTKEGDVFVVPLLNGKYAIGLIARKNGKIALGYFFDTVFESPPSQVGQSVLSNRKIALIAKFSTMGIDDGEWPLAQTNIFFAREEWPIPLFKMQEPITKVYFAVVYEEDLLHDTRYKISESEAAEYFQDGLSGYVALSNKLSKILKAET